MNFRLLKLSALALASFACATPLLVSPAAAAGQIATFNFDQMGNGTTGQFNASGQNASSSQISNYMTWELHNDTTYDSYNVTVTGGIGEQGASSYTGDNHVVGPVTGGTVYPLTLADTNGLVNPSDMTQWDTNPPLLSNTNPDGFIKNCTSIDPTTYSRGKKGCGASSSDILINFNGLKIYSFSFDFEIFPDASCASLTNCPSLPDLEIWSGDNATGVNFGMFYGIVPGGGENPVTCTSAGTTNPTYNQSGGGKYNGTTGAPIYNSPVTETAPQLLCHASYTVSDFKNAAGFPTGGVTSLDFMDWPETIGIDNLVVTIGTPEPATIGLFALGIVGLAALRRRRARSARRFASPI